MLGVVLWSDAADRKAVIWCEDQGDLAYVNTPEQVLDAEGFFDAGDLVQFDMETSQSTRYANNARLVVENARPSLAGVLKGTGSSAPDFDTNTNVIPLRPQGIRRQALEA